MGKRQTNDQFPKFPSEIGLAKLRKEAEKNRADITEMKTKYEGLKGRADTEETGKGGAETDVQNLNVRTQNERSYRT